MSVLKEADLTTIHYPESDGEAMAETDLHRRLMTDLIFALQAFFHNAPAVYVSGNLLLYYVEGEPKKNVAPDVFVVRGAGQGLRRTYKLWEEKLPPNVVIEVSSDSTWEKDLQEKWLTYQQIGVREYFIFDPEYSHLQQPRGYRLREGAYERLEVVDGRLHSEELGLDLVDTGATLRLYDPRAAQFLLTEAEAIAAREADAEARRQAEAALQAEAAARRAEAEARQRTEAELARLQEELERLRRQPSQ